MRHLIVQAIYAALFGVCLVFFLWGVYLIGLHP